MLFYLAAALLQSVQSESVEVPGTKLRFELVALPGGKATIGSPPEEPGHRDDEKRREVTLLPFALGAREVTWKEFNAFWHSKNLDGVTRPTDALSYIGENIPEDFRQDNRPMTNARWHSAVMYCEWLSRKTGRYFRLPTEAEWEYSARAGSDAPGPDPLDEAGWYKANSKDRTHVGGEKKANAMGVFDLMGNVWEYALEPYAPPDYGPVLRGGCYSSVPKELRYAHRQTIPFKWFDDDSNSPRSVWWLTAAKVSIGFRVACAADASDLKEREAYASKLAITFAGSDEKTIMTNKSPALYRAVRGEIRNAGERSVDEVELKVVYLEADGRTPHWIDQTACKPGRACFSKTWPVLVNSALGGETVKPLRPNETRAFSVDLPLSCDIEYNKVKIAFEGQITALRFSK